MQEKFGIVIEAVTSQFQAKMNEIKNLGQQTADKVKQAWTTTRITPEVDTSSVTKIAELKRQISNLKSEFKYIEPNTPAFNEYARAIDKAEKELKQLNTAQKQVKRNSKSLSGIGLNVKKMGNEFSNAIKKVRRFALALLSVRSIYSLISRAAQAYLSFDTELSEKMQNLWAGLGAQLAPILEYIINLFAKAVAYINAFIQALTGINLVARANTKALNKQSGAAKSTSKALTSLDEITNVSKDTGGGGGANQISLPEVNTSNLEEFIKKLKSGKFFELGETIGRKITESLERIPWDTIKEKAGWLGYNIAQFINGGIKGTNWKVVGNTLAQSINTAIEFSYNFVKTFNWKKFGKSMGEMFSTAFNNVDWGKLAKTISKGLIGIFDSITEYLKAIDWKKVGKNIRTFFANLDYTGIAKAIIKALIEAIKSVITLSASATADYDDIGENIVMGIYSGMLGPLAWLAERTFGGSFIRKIKDFLGIHSPSTVFEEIGKNIIEGLAKGIGDIWKKIKGKFESFETSVKNKLNQISQIKTTITIGIKGKFDEFKKKMKNLFSNEGIIGKVFNWGAGQISQAKNWLASLDTGTNYVPEDQLAYIHKGEAVVPKKFNSAEYFSNINNNQETNALLLEVNKTLIEIREKDTTLKVNGKELARTTYNDFKNEGNRLGQSSVVSVR